MSRGLSIFEKVTQYFRSPDARSDVQSQPLMSIILIVHHMSHQAENTARSLFIEYQHGVQEADYEVIIVENESEELMSPEFIRSLPINFHYHLRTSPEKSPGPAINFGVRKAQGSHICVLIDGARILTPGTLKNMIRGHQLGSTAVISVPGYHLGNELQQEAVKRGYDTEAEVELLRTIVWPDNGYRLFEVSCLNGSSGLGFFLPNSESNCISMPRDLWNALGGYDSSFDLPGGGLINLDFYKRACEYPGVLHIILPGEGTFHQLHGGVTTGGQDDEARAEYIADSNRQYRELRGEEYENPRTKPVYLGEIPREVMQFLHYSADLAMKLDDQEISGRPH